MDGSLPCPDICCMSCISSLLALGLQITRPLTSTGGTGVCGRASLGRTLRHCALLLNSNGSQKGNDALDRDLETCCSRFVSYLDLFFENPVSALS